MSSKWLSTSILWLKDHIRAISILIFTLICYIIFEAFQQQFYAENFNNGQANTSSIWEFLAGGLIRWSIWVLLAALMTFSLRKLAAFNHRHFLHFTALTGLYVLAGVLLATILFLIRRGGPWNGFLEVYEFYFFHKAPILFLFFISVLVFRSWLLQKATLALHVEELGALRYSNTELFNRIAKSGESVDERSLILHVKTGNNSRIIKVEEIYWIEADDYCAKIHLRDATHTIRHSLSKLEKRLPSHFSRVHRGAIVNLKFASSFSWLEPLSVSLKNDQVIKMANSRTKDVKQVLGQLGI